MASLDEDEAMLSKASSEVATLDKDLKAAKNQVFKDEVALSKANDAYLVALKKGDTAGADELKKKILALQADEDVAEKQAITLAAKEAEAVELEKTAAGRLASDKKEQIAMEDAKYLDEEKDIVLGELEESGNPIANFIGKFFG